jgi:ribonuclease BN (tRNA processing enzyme)
MYADVASRPLPFRLEFSELLPERDYACGGMRILPFRAPHLEDPPSFGCVVEAGGRKIVYTGDSGWTEDLVAQTHNADLFICECSYFDTRLATHLDYLRIAENLDRLGAKRIILTHLGEELLKRQQEVKLEMAYDGMSVQL